MITLPPNHYCIIKNPVIRNPDGSFVRDLLAIVHLLTVFIRKWVSTKKSKLDSKNSRSEHRLTIQIHSHSTPMKSFSKELHPSFNWNIMKLLFSEPPDILSMIEKEMSKDMQLMSISLRGLALIYLEWKRKYAIEHMQGLSWLIKPYYLELKGIPRMLTATLKKLVNL